MSAETPRKAEAGAVLRDAKVAPLYPPTRILRSSALVAEKDLAETRAWAQSERDRARELTERAQAEAAQLLAAARAEVERLQAQAISGARAEARAELESLLAAADREVRALADRFADEVQRTAFRFARAVLDVEFHVRPARIVDLVQRVLERTDRYRQVRVHVHPDDVAFLREAAEGLRSRVQCEFQVVPDAELPRRGVRVSTEMGSFWAGVAEQLKPLREHLGIPAEDEP